jgi:hypothetical protein
LGTRLRAVLARASSSSASGTGATRTGAGGGGDDDGARASVGAPGLRHRPALGGWSRGSERRRARLLHLAARRAGRLARGARARRVRAGRGRGAGALGAGERQLQERRLGLNVGGAAPAALAALGGGKESRRLGGECRGRGRSAGVWRGDGGRRALLGAGRVGVGWSRWWRRDGRCRGEKIGGGGGCAEGAGEGRREQGEAGGWRERPTAGEKKLTLVL